MRWKQMQSCKTDTRSFDNLRHQRVITQLAPPRLRFLCLKTGPASRGCQTHTPMSNTRTRSCRCRRRIPLARGFLRRSCRRFWRCRFLARMCNIGRTLSQRTKTRWGCWCIALCCLGRAGASTFPASTCPPSAPSPPSLPLHTIPRSPLVPALVVFTRRLVLLYLVGRPGPPSPLAGCSLACRYTLGWFSTGWGPIWIHARVQWLDVIGITRSACRLGGVWQTKYRFACGGWC